MIMWLFWWVGVRVTLKQSVTVFILNLNKKIKKFADKAFHIVRKPFITASVLIRSWT